MRLPFSFSSGCLVEMGVSTYVQSLDCVSSLCVREERDGQICRVHRHLEGYISWIIEIKIDLGEKEEKEPISEQVVGTMESCWGFAVALARDMVNGRCVSAREKGSASSG